MSEFFNQEDDDLDYSEAEKRLEEAGLLGSTLILGCAQVEDDFLAVRRIGDVEHAEGDLEPVVSLMVHTGEVAAADGLISGGIMLSAEGARVLAAHLMNAADEIDGFQAMFQFSTGEGVEDE